MGPTETPKTSAAAAADAAAVDWDRTACSYTDLIARRESEHLQLRATLHLARLANHAPEPALAATVPTLLDLLADAPRPDLQQAAAHALSRLARRRDSNLSPVIAQFGAIPSILRHLPSSNDAFRRSLLLCLGALVAFDIPNRVMLARAGGLEAVIALLSSPADPAAKRYLLEILSSLALLREVRRVIAGHGGMPFLVEALSCGKMFFRTQAAQAVGLLGISRRARHMLVEMGAILGLVGLLRDGDAQARITAGNALGIISSHVACLGLVAQAGAIPLYAKLLEGADLLGKEIAEDVFCVLAVAEDNAVMIVEHLVRILQGNDEEAKAAAVDVLWDLSGYKNSVTVMRESGAIRLLLGILREGDGDVRVKASGAVAQLSYDDANRRSMAAEGAIPVLFCLLRGDSDELREYAAEAVINFSEDLLFREQVSEALEIQSFREIQERLSHVRASNEHMIRSMRLMSVDQLTADPDLL